ncbi:MAG: class I SAM-dependent methyltransferase [Zetaproteobacteria bacterium]|nr:class I SAM-dependent methyltransferase [Zetaproteobacteria bacterium]
MNQIDAAFVKAFLENWQQKNETIELDTIAAHPTTIALNGAEIPQTAQVNSRYGRFLYHLVKQFKPQKVLEIGMANGVSSAYIASAMATYQPESGNHTIIDPFQSTDWQGAGKHLLQRLHLDRYTQLIEHYSIHAVTQLEDAGKRFDFAFIDGNHCLDYTLADVIVADRVLNIGGLIALDDSMAYGVNIAIPYLDQHRPNLRRILLDPPAIHWLREKWFKRRRITIYQKIAEDTRGADTI